MVQLSVPTLLLPLLALASCTFQQGTGPAPGQIKNIVTFGDSYTDVTAGGDGVGGTMWPVYVADYANLTLFPYAKAGATCSGNFTPRIYPSVFESQLPTFFSEVQNGTVPQLDPNETVYTLWIGTNDVGVGELLTGQQTPGATLVDTIGCAVNWVQTLFNFGARNFIFQNMVPLEKTILSPDSYPNHYWDLERNTTEWSLFISEMVASGNALSRLMLETKVPSLPDAHIGYFDSHSLFNDMYFNPQNYFNGTAPLNVTGAVFPCVLPLNAGPTSVPFCTPVSGAAADSFLWYDELHPSEQSDRNVARHIANAIMGNTTDTQFISWLS